MRLFPYLAARDGNEKAEVFSKTQIKLFLNVIQLTSLELNYFNFLTPDLVLEQAILKKKNIIIIMTVLEASVKKRKRFSPKNHTNTFHYNFLKAKIKIY